MIKRTTKYFVLFFLMCGALNCGQANTESTVSPAQNSSVFVPDSNLKMAFTLQLDLDAEDDSLDFIMNLDEEFVLPMRLESSGKLSLNSREIPKMIHRICAMNSKRTGCDAYTDALGGLEVDVVIDSCGRLTADKDCGLINSKFHGTLTQDGDMIMQDLSMRMRAFELTSTESGVTASDDSPGLLVMNRIIVDLTTSKVSSGSLSNIGTVVKGKAVTLVTSGKLSSTVPAAGGANFMATLKGNFDTPPLNLLSK